MRSISEFILISVFSVAVFWGILFIVGETVEHFTQ